MSCFWRRMLIDKNHVYMRIFEQASEYRLKAFGNINSNTEI